MAEYEGVHLRLTPQAIPAVREAFERALDLLEPEITRLGEVGYIHAPWMGDPKSEEVRLFYNARVMDAVDGPYQALVLYQEELRRVRDQLAVMEQEYQRAETENGDLFGRAL